MKLNLENIFKYKIILVILFCVLFKQVHAGNGIGIFNQDTVHEIRIYFSQTHYWDTLTVRYEKVHEIDTGTVKPVMASIVIDGKKIDSVGVKLKGNFSYSIPTSKKPMKIDFNAFVKGKNYDGLVALNLSNEYPDPSLLRNSVAFKLYHDRKLIAPRLSFSRVYVNDVFKGLYAVIEQTDKPYLRRHFGNASGTLIKPLSSPLFYSGMDSSSFHTKFEVKSKDTHAAWADLIDLCRKIENTSADDFYDSLKTLIDFDSFISLFATDIVLNNWDSYLYGQNYYLYRDTASGKYFFLPWDYNISLNNYDISGGDLSILPGYTHDHLFQLPMTSKVIRNKFLKEKYLNEICRLNKLLSDPSTEKFINKMHALIRPALKEDSLMEMSIAEFDATLYQPLEISEIEFAGLSKFIRNRCNQITSLLKKEKFTCVE
jgi:hypothetical protein